jgi:hypothetical protein
VLGPLASASSLSATSCVRALQAAPARPVGTPTAASVAATQERIYEMGRAADRAHATIVAEANQALADAETTL